jgi:hypothetical protein
MNISLFLCLLFYFGTMIGLRGWMGGGGWEEEDEGGNEMRFVCHDMKAWWMAVNVVL